MHNTLVFIHGLESTAKGAKGQYFSKNFPEMIIEDFTGGFAARMTKLNQMLAGKKDLIIVGSSYGGLMAVTYAMKNEKRMKKLILLAPALNLSEFQPCLEKSLSIPVIVYHGNEDDVVKPERVRKISEKCFKNREYHLVVDDHPLHKTFPLLHWRKLLEVD